MTWQSNNGYIIIYTSRKIHSGHFADIGGKKSFSELIFFLIFGNLYILGVMCENFRSFEFGVQFNFELLEVERRFTEPFTIVS